MEKDQLILLGALAEGYIKAHLSEKLDRDTICRALSTNRTTLSRAIILRTGRTLRRYILDERIRKSKNLLLSGTQTMDRIAEACGFSDRAYFVRAFKEQTGMTPAAYAKNERERNDSVTVFNLASDIPPALPQLYDCAVSRMDADGEYLTICFDDAISRQNLVSRFPTGASKLTVRFHLVEDSGFSVYRHFQRGKRTEKEWESGYSLCGDKKEFIEEVPGLKLYYGFHCTGYEHVVVNLWSTEKPYAFMLTVDADRVEYEWGSAPRGTSVIDRMKVAGVPFAAGMSEEEITSAERAFGFTFPKEIAAFLHAGMPADERFFNFRDLSPSNAAYFRKFERMIEEKFVFDLTSNPACLRDMERKYRTSGVKETFEAVMRDYESGPKLIPFYGFRRCFFDGLDGMPILSFAGLSDTIMYGENFEDYLAREFCGEKRAFSVQAPQTLGKAGFWASIIATTPYIAAHDHCTCNKSELEKSKKCGCFYCLRIFSPKKVDQFIDSGKTALCPFCGIDAVIGDASGYSVTQSFLQTMHDRWFSTDKKEKR